MGGEAAGLCLARDSQNGNFEEFICGGVLLWGSECDIVFVVVEIGAALAGRVFRLGRRVVGNRGAIPTSRAKNARGMGHPSSENESTGRIP
jgi:hypothetical protein